MKCFRASTLQPQKNAAKTLSFYSLLQVEIINNNKHWWSVDRRQILIAHDLHNQIAYRINRLPVTSLRLTGVSKGGCEARAPFDPYCSNAVNLCYYNIMKQCIKFGKLKQNMIFTQADSFHFRAAVCLPWCPPHYPDNIILVMPWLHSFYFTLTACPLPSASKQ